MRLAPHYNTAKDHKRARELRNNASPIERKLWVVLREATKAANLKFRRQQPIRPYIVDFACMAAKLLIEIDGDTHVDKRIYDATRDAFLRSAGYTVMRFYNSDVVANAEGVAAKIIEYAFLLLNAPLPAPPLKGEGSLSQLQILEQSQ